MRLGLVDGFFDHRRLFYLFEERRFLLLLAWLPVNNGGLGRQFQRSLVDQHRKQDEGEQAVAEERDGEGGETPYRVGPDLQAPDRSLDSGTLAG